jgi:pheromone shutdown protein TraB
MRKTVLTYGLISGGILVLVLLITIPFMDDMMDSGTGEWLGYISMIAALSVIFIGIKNFRDNNSGGMISFGKAFLIGLNITLVASVFYIAGWVTYMNTSDSDFIENYTKHTIEELQNSGESQDVIDKKRAEMEDFAEMYKNPFIQIVFTFLEIFPVGLLISLIAAIILKTNKMPASL